MKDFFNGKHSLALTYWVGVWLAGVVMKGTMVLINKGYLSSDVRVAERTEIIHYALITAFAIYLILMVRALWRAGCNDRTPGFWGWAGVILTTLSAAYVGYTALNLYFPSMRIPLFMVGIELQALNKQLPQVIDAQTVLSKVSLNGDVMIYTFDVAVQLDAGPGPHIEAMSLDDPDAQAVCQEIHGYFKGGVSTLSYRYEFQDAAFVNNLHASDCLNWLAEQR